MSVRNLGERMSLQMLIDRVAQFVAGRPRLVRLVVWVVVGGVLLVLWPLSLAWWMWNTERGIFVRRVIPILLILFGITAAVGVLTDSSDDDLEPVDAATVTTAAEASAADGSQADPSSPSDQTSSAPTTGQPDVTEQASTTTTTAPATTTTTTSTPPTTVAATTTTLGTTTSTSTTLAPVADVQIVATHCDAAGSDLQNLDDEYITIENLGDLAQPMAGWELHDTGPDRRFDFPADLTLEPGDTAIVRSGIGFRSGNELYWGFRWEVWDNGTDTAHLRNETGELVSTMSC